MPRHKSTPCDPRHEDVSADAFVACAAYSVRYHAQLPVRCVGATLCWGRQDEMTLHSHAANGLRRGRRCAARARCARHDRGCPRQAGRGAGAGWIEPVPRENAQAFAEGPLPHDPNDALPPPMPGPTSPWALHRRSPSPFRSVENQRGTALHCWASLASRTSARQPNPTPSGA
ncbi:hypothetical protein EDB92DRAFT_1905358 [Lactarius akahatsu]|uniref:Uncharacterized protein n=1 Tax=Lactarius akahatsu TaxID=416441 RepID=A0AAD4L9C8_9AGAM|nr:hypothetical protein EDB92DRAFT_1905358 [Lactarius akahatsu]